MNKKRRARTVATQSTGVLDHEALPQTGRLCKKAGFRDLLQRSAIVVTQDNDEVAEKSTLPRERASKSVQAAMDYQFQNPRLKTGQSLDLSVARRHSSGRDDESGGTASEMVRLIDRQTAGSNPGISRATSAGYSAYSIISEINEVGMRPREGSMAIVYNYGEKPLGASGSSNLGFLYGSQGSRRFSDETVLLIEDYQSYDYNNAARRLEEPPVRRSGRSCCRSSKRGSTENQLTRPLPIDFEDIEEKDETMVCRICHDGEDVEPLIQPCLCKGSIGSVHAGCLKIWLEQSNTSRCELCNYPYAIQQTRKYTKCLSIRVFFKTVVDRRAMAYDVTSLVIITPLTLVGVAMCIQASLYSGDSGSGSSYKMGNITKAGMVMLSVTIVVAFAVWFYTLISYYYKSWRKWYANCYDVEVLPVRMTSEERLEAARRLSQEMGRRQTSRERGSGLVTVLNSPNNRSFHQRRISATPGPPDPLAAPVPPAVHANR